MSALSQMSSSNYGALSEQNSGTENYSRLRMRIKKPPGGGFFVLSDIIVET